jgi:hypothetical protein
VIDSLGTALGFGLDAGDIDSDVEPFGRDALFAPDDADADSFLSLLNSWAELTVVLNELARSMGHRDFYPFVDVEAGGRQTAVRTHGGPRRRQGCGLTNSND